jgi:cobalt-zinc-cadmium efflux system membrane fusion protein
MKHLAILSLALVTLLTIGCDHKAASSSKHDKDNETSQKIEHRKKSYNKGEEGVVELTKEQVETVGLELNSLEKKSLGNSIKVTGQLELFPQDRANISPLVGGNVRSINIIEGDKVIKGQVLAYLEHLDIITMQQEYQEKNNQLAFLKKDFERKQTLYNKGVASGREFQMAQSKFKSTTSSVNGLRAKLRLLGIHTDKVLQGQIFSAMPITTPISGYVDEVMINLGDYAAPQTKMFTVSDNSEIHVDFKVYEKDIRKVKEGQEIYFTVAAKPNELLKAKIHAIGKTFESEPKALHVHADVHNENKELLPGMYVEGRIVQDKKMAFAVPEDAIIKDGAQSFIFILYEEGKKVRNKIKFKMIPVNIGIADLEFVEISLSLDITKDLKVVTKGAYALSSEMVKSELKHGH